MRPINRKPRPRKNDVAYYRYAVDDPVYGTAEERIIDAITDQQRMDRDEASEFVGGFEDLGMRDFLSRAVGPTAFSIDESGEFGDGSTGRYTPEGRMYKDEDSGQVRYQPVRRLDKKGNSVYGRGVPISASNLADIVGVDDIKSLPPSVRQELTRHLSDPATASYFGDIYGEPARFERAYTIDPGALRRGLNKNAGRSAFGESAQQRDQRKGTPSGIRQLFARIGDEKCMSDSCREMMRNKRSQIPLGERIFSPMPGSKRELRQQRERGGQQYRPGLFARLGLSRRFKRS
jgi:hypothetical protein